MTASQNSMVKKRFELVANMFRTDAILHFRKDRDMYSQAWADFLPKGFIDMAKKASAALKAKAVRGIT
jgi:hypothetical protein